MLDKVVPKKYRVGEGIINHGVVVYRGVSINVFISLKANDG